MRAWLIVIGCVACGHRADDRKEAPPPPPRPVAGSAAPIAAPVAIDAGVALVVLPGLPPPADLLGAIPADAPFAFVTLEPSDLPKHVLGELDAKLLLTAASSRTSTLDPFARIRFAAWAELARALANPDPLKSLGLGRRFAAYGTGTIPVVRVELADPVVAAATLARVMKAAGQPGAGPTWIVDGGASSELVAIAGNQLVVARGPHDVIHTRSAQVVGAAATPITDAALRTLASSHGLDPRGIGWVDPAQVAKIVMAPGAIPELDEAPPACRAEVAAALSSFDRIAFGISELTASRIAIAASVPVAEGTTTALAAVAKAVPSLPPALAGKPMLALSIVAPPPALWAVWNARGKKLSAACSGEDVTVLAPPWDTVRAAAVVVYSAKWQSLFPSAVDGYAGLDATDLDGVAAVIANVMPGFTAPKDNAPFTQVSAGKLSDLVQTLAVARRDHALVFTTGPLAAAHVSELVHHDAAPLFRLFVDVARLRQPEAAPAMNDDQFFTAGGAFAEESSLEHVRDAVFGAISLTVEARAGEIRTTFATDANPHAPRAQPSSDPRSAIRDQCRTILRHGLANTGPALAKLGVVDQLDELATTYTTSIEADGAIRTCATLPPAARKCLLDAPNVLTAAATCAPSTDHFHDSAFELPPLISFFGPNPLEARIHPKVDGAAVVAKLRGTWVRKGTFKTETWTIDAAGKLVVTEQDKGSNAPTTKTYKLGAKEAGELELAEGTSTSRRWFYMVGNDQFVSNGEGASITSETHFVIPLDSGFLVREPTGCWFVTEKGALVDAKCTQQQHELAVAYTPACTGTDCERTEKLSFGPGFVVATRTLTDDKFIRQK